MNPNDVLRSFRRAPHSANLALQIFQLIPTLHSFMKGSSVRARNHSPRIRSAMWKGRLGSYGKCSQGRSTCRLLFGSSHSQLFAVGFLQAELQIHMVQLFHRAISSVQICTETHPVHTESSWNRTSHLQHPLCSTVLKANRTPIFHVCCELRFVVV